MAAVKRVFLLSLFLVIEAFNLWFLTQAKSLKKIYSHFAKLQNEAFYCLFVCIFRGIFGVFMNLTFFSEQFITQDLDN